MTRLSFDQRRALRELISQHARESLTTTCPNGWGSTTGYRRGCRCADCTFATSNARRMRKKRAA